MSFRILLADHNPANQTMGNKILTDAGYEVVAVSSGTAAVKKIAEHKPDIIILDVYMPGFTGLEVLAKVRDSIETPKTPVLLTVGKMEPYEPEKASRIQADGVIVKPFEASDLLAIVKKLERRIVPIAGPASQSQEQSVEDDIAHSETIPDPITSLDTMIIADAASQQNTPELNVFDDHKARDTEGEIQRVVSAPFVRRAIEDEAVARKYVVARYHTLVNRKYVDGLSSVETEELEGLKATLDEMDEPYYAAIIRRLRALAKKEAS